MLFLLTTFALESRCKNTNISRHGKIKKCRRAEGTSARRQCLCVAPVIRLFYRILVRDEDAAVPFSLVKKHFLLCFAKLFC